MNKNGILYSKKIYDTNNSSLVTNLIYNHISRWINDISDLSNDKQESIERLQEYKCIMNFKCNNRPCDGVMSIEIILRMPTKQYKDFMKI